MKVLHVVPTYLPAYRYGGPIESVHALNKYLVRAGAEVTVFTTAIDGAEDLNVPLGVPVDVDGVQVYYFKPSFPRAWFYSSELARALKMRAHEFDVIHITSVFLAASTLGARAARTTGKPYIISPRGSLMRAPLTKKSAAKKNIYLKLVENRNLKEAAAIHFTTDLERVEYAEMKLPSRRSIVIPNGLDGDSLPPGDPVNFRAKFGIAPKDKVVLFLSRLSWKKGLDTLVGSFASLLKEMPEAKLVIVGGDDEGYRAQVEQFIDKEGIKEKVVFTGELHGAEKSAAYQAADVFCLPSYAENFGGVVLEAMHFGVPVVITPEVGVAPQILASEAGFVIKKDELQIKFALHKILSNPNLAKSLGENGKKLVQNEFSYTAVAKQFIELYNELIEGSRRNNLPPWKR